MAAIIKKRIKNQQETVSSDSQLLQIWQDGYRGSIFQIKKFGMGGDGTYGTAGRGQGTGMILR